MLAALRVEQRFRPGPADETEAGREAPADRPVALAGPLEGVQLPLRYDFRDLRPTPAELRARFARLGWRRVLAWQAPEPLHRAEVALALSAVKEAGANLLLHPAVGLAEAGEVGHYTRVRCLQAVLGHFPPRTAELALLPLAMRFAGARAGLLSALVARNYGCSHLLLGAPRDGTGAAPADAAPAELREAVAAIERHAGEVGVVPLTPRRMVYVQGLDAHLPEDEVPADRRARDLSADELRSFLAEGREVPAWFSYPEVIRELSRAYPPTDRRGFTVFFTGLSGAGKSTVANVLLVQLLEMGGRPVTLLDGDIVRRHLSSELGFSKEHRDINIRRIGFVASEITKNGGIALCAPIAPYDSVRREVRRMVEERGGFVLVHVATPIEVCESRDRKGLYAKARAGLIKEFTGVSDPYEVPEDADVYLDTANLSPEEAAQEVVLHLEREGYIGAGR
jgi:sulfate adenylyltransferase